MAERTFPSTRLRSVAAWRGIWRSTNVMGACRYEKAK
jgi:hypothetical protein